MRKLYTVLLAIVCLLGKAYAQQGNSRLIDANYNHADITQVVADLQSKTGYRFYYDPVQFDSLRVTINISQKNLNDVLNRIFESSPYHYAFSGSDEVVLTKDREIRTTLPAGFFNNTQGSVAVTEKVTDYSNDVAGKKIPESTSENKLYQIGIPSNKVGAGNATLAGYTLNVRTGEPVAGASIYIPSIKISIATNPSGYYSISLPRGRQTLIIRALGMKDTRRQVVLYSDGELNIDMQDQVISLKEVKISSEKVANIRGLEMGVSKLDIKSLKQVPSVFGEADVLRVVLTLPGVQTVGEASTGFNVRGGSADQNLILLNDATIYNPSHFFGFFSAFDPDIVQSVELYKSSIPEKFGGRLSSVLEITEREGNKKKFTGNAGIGLITSRFNIEGPIGSDKTSFILGARTTYADWLLKSLPAAYAHSSASFYDINFNISHKIDNKNNLYLTTYISNDGFRLNSDTTYSYGNRNATLKWRHNFNNKLYSEIIGGYDYYQYSIVSAANKVDAFRFNSNISQANFKTNFTYYLNPKHTVTFGLSTIRYQVNPGSNMPFNSNSQIAPTIIEQEQALESALYAGDKFDITPSFSISAGLRYSLYNYLGPHTVNYYAPGEPKTTNSLVTSTPYSSNNVIDTYHGPEIRASARYILGDDFSVKASYNTLRQYIHLLSNTTAISPTDVWKLSDPNIKPQYGDQVSLGLYKNLKSNTIETSAEVYYKNLKNYLDYKSGATLVLNPHIETDVLPTHGKAYGIEFLVKKTTGQLNGWISYTYSRTFLRQDNPAAGPLINNGAYYPANYDKPHSVNFIGNYRFSHRYSVSLNTIYSTGRPITYPIAAYYYDGSQRVLYSDRNQYRIPDYFRTDFSINIDGNHKVHQFFHSSWTIGVYNLTGRNNAYSTYFSEQGGQINGYKLSIFANPIPFVNYNIKF
ncbi:MAG: TonB-dependent receptor [Mucilaginibacter sp.]|nr:TonB-dependent receptor [Mucilaginibacter sp.]